MQRRPSEEEPIRSRLPIAVASALAFLLTFLGPASAGMLTSIDQFGTNAYDEAWGVAIDPSGVTYVAGTTAGAMPGQVAAGGNDAFVRATAPDGTVLWVRQFGTKHDDRAFFVAIDGLGGIYVTGVTAGKLPGQTKDGGFDSYVRKYDADGNALWTRQLGTSADDIASEVAADASGVIVIGNTGGALGGTNRGHDDVFLRAFDPNGNERWTKQFGTPKTDIGFGLALPGDGSFFAIGFTLGALPGQRNHGGNDGWVRRYGSDGTITWTREFGTSDQDLAFGMAVQDDVLYVSGTTFGSFGGQGGGSGDPFVRALDATDGATLWTRQGGSPAEDWSTNLAVDANGPYVVGYTFGDLAGPNQGRSDVFVWALDTQGADRFTTQFGTPKTDFGNWSTIDGGSLVVVGFAGGAFEGQTNLGRGDAYVASLPTTG